MVDFIPTPIKVLSNKYKIEKDKTLYDLIVINEEKDIIFQCRNEKILKMYERKLSKNDLEEISDIFKGCKNLNEVYNLMINLLENKQYEVSVNDESISIKFNKINIFEFKNIILSEKEIDISEKVENSLSQILDLMKEINLLKIQNENLQKEIDCLKKKQDNNLNILGEEYELINVDLLNGASNFGEGYNPFRVYKLKNNFVKISGLINCTQNKNICQLPENCRPKGRLIFNCFFNGFSNRVDVFSDGNICPYGTGSGWLSLDNILFLSGK